MKINSSLYFILITAIVSGCSSDKQTQEGLAFVDVRKNYPEKEIFLTDIAEVSYLYLNSDDDDYLFQGRIHCITENTVVVGDDATGSILFFSKNGDTKSRFNRKGQGPEEYIGANQIIYDEPADDVFVLSLGRNFLQVYSSTGEYKRKIIMPEGTEVGLYYSFDNESLFIYDASASNERKVYMDQIGETDFAFFDHRFFLISKKDGKILDFVDIPSASQYLGTYSEELGTFIPGRTTRILKCKEGILLCNPETDTVFLYSKNRTLTPVIYQTPSVSALDPVIYLNNCVDAGRYQFMEVFTLQYNVLPYPVKYLLRDKETGEVFRQKILLPDYKGKEFIISPIRSGRDYENGPWFELDLSELKEAYRENRLSGKLKELVATLNEDVDNNVFMLVKFK